jgi:GTP-binding protein HflX
MTGAEVLAKDMLFATLDPTMRGIKLPSGRGVILSDTVGFISDLPTQLVAAFRATLEEVLEADLILHVRDISHQQTEEQAADVATILTGLGVTAETPQIEVWNKIDLLPADQREAMAAIAARTENVVAISALTGEGIAVLSDAAEAALREETTEEALTLPFSEGRRRAWLHAQGVVVAERQGDAGFEISVRWTTRQKARFLALETGQGGG